jgi:hypothetical protein
MIEYSIYNEVTGEIIANNFCSETDFYNQGIREGFKIILGNLPYDKYYIDTSDNTPVEIPSRSNKYFYFDYSTKSIKIDVDLLALDSKEKRDLLLSRSDWTDTLSAKERLSSYSYQEWKDYRQALRDVPQQKNFPENIIWPIKPE